MDNHHSERRYELTERSEVRVTRLAAELAETAELLATVAARVVTTAQGAPDIHDALMTHAEVAARSARAVADIAAPLFDTAKAPLS